MAEWTLNHVCFKLILIYVFMWLVIIRLDSIKTQNEGPRKIVSHAKKRNKLMCYISSSMHKNIKYL